MKRNWLRGIVSGLSFTSALFIFQACYGTPQDFQSDILVQGQVKSKTSGLPIEGVRVSVADIRQFDYSNEAGEFSFYTGWIDYLTIKFTDVDSTQNGSFVDRDTVLTNIRDDVYLNIEMAEK